METGSHTATGGAYPGKDQIRQLWIWNNTLNDVPNGLRLEGPDASTLIKENRDSFLRQPNQTDDGLNYKPYPYPHPLAN